MAWQSRLYYLTWIEEVNHWFLAQTSPDRDTVYLLLAGWSLQNLVLFSFIKSSAYLRQALVTPSFTCVYIHFTTWKIHWWEPKPVTSFQRPKWPQTKCKQWRAFLFEATWAFGKMCSVRLSRCAAGKNFLFNRETPEGAITNSCLSEYRWAVNRTVVNFDRNAVRAVKWMTEKWLVKEQVSSL